MSIDNIIKEVLSGMSSDLRLFIHYTDDEGETAVLREIENTKYKMNDIDELKYKLQYIDYNYCVNVMLDKGIEIKVDNLIKFDGFMITLTVNGRRYVRNVYENIIK